MFFLLTLLLGIWCTDGCWEVVYLSKKGCTGSMNSATKLTSRCIDFESKGQQVSIRYSCDKAPSWNVSVNVYSGSGCYGAIVHSEHIGDTNKCFVEKEDTVSAEWKCIEDYEVKYSNLKFAIPMHVDKEDIGSKDNPVIGEHYSGVVKCFKDPRLTHHVTSICEKGTQVGEFKMYEGPLCLVPVHTVKMKPGEVVDFSKFVKEEGKMFMKYEGCTIV